MKTLIKLIGMSLFIFFLIPAGFAQVTSPEDLQRENSYSNWDSNQDNQIDRDEFISAFGSQKYYNTWDANGDNQLNEEEWEIGISERYSDYNGMYSDWDMDADTYINEDEFSEGTFNLWDEDYDGYISQEEFNTWSYDNQVEK